MSKRRGGSAGLWCDRSFVVLALTISVGCGLPSGRGGTAGPVVVAEGTGAPLDAIPQVPRLQVTGLPSLAPADLWLIRGRLSSASAGRIRRRDIPAVVEQQRVPSSVWRASDELLLAPQAPLEAGAEYTLLGLGMGELASLVTLTKKVRVFHRSGSGRVLPGGAVVYCDLPQPFFHGVGEEGDASVPELPTHARLEPSGVEASVLAGAGPSILQGRCLRLILPASAEGVLIPPQRFVAGFLDPGPIAVARPESPHSAEGGAPTAGREEEGGGQGGSGPALGEVGQGPDPDAVEPHVWLEGSSLWATVPEGAAWFSLRTSAEATRRWASWEGQGLTRFSLGTLALGEVSVTGTFVDPRGRQEQRSWTLQVGSQTGHLVLTEVLANPLGPEPAGEWVELSNAGRAPVFLGGYLLVDGTGETPLPPVELSAGQVAVIVNESYVPQPELDPVPVASSLPLVVPRLGEGGLLNSGEMLTLLAPDGRQVSRMVAGETRAGQSWARRHLLFPDVAAGFASHGAPGSSPGAANSFD